MVSFSCEGCGDVLTKKKLDPHRNQCYGASFTCLDCMVHFDGTSYRAHTSCITEDQKYQGKLYKEKKKPQHQKKDSAQHESQALVPRNAYVEDAYDADSGAVAIVDAPPRAPTPPPALNSLGYGDYREPAALPPVNVFDFLDVTDQQYDDEPTAPVDESRMIEDSAPPAYEEQEAQQPIFDVMSFQVSQEDGTGHDGVTYGTGAINVSTERHDSTLNLREQAPDFNFTTPAPKAKHGRTKSKDVDTTIKKEERKRKRSSPPGLDMSLVKAQREKDIMMEDAPPMLHSGLTGGLNRLLARPEFPPSPEYSGEYAENSPLSPMKRARQGASKAFMRAQQQYEQQQKLDRKAESKEERRERERGRDRERIERHTSNALVKVRPKKKRDGSERPGRRHRESDRHRRRNYSSSRSRSPARERKTVKMIEARRSGSGSPGPNGNSQLIVRPNGDMVPVRTEYEARAELFMSFVTKGPDSERGMSINKTLKRYHRERADRWDRDNSKAEEEKELWKSMRLRRNDRGEIVLFFAPPEAA